MQHKNGILAITVLMGVFSCTHREEGGIQKVKFQAIQADGPSTKTVLEADGSVFWSPGDAVSLFYGGATIQKTKLTAENTSAAAQTIFSGVLDGFLPDGSTDFWAVYPYSADTDFDGTAVTVTVPAEQTAVEGTFSSDAFVSIATSKDYTLQFYNLCGGIKFSVANQGIQSVIFSGNNDEILAGQVQATFDENGKPVVTEVVKGTMELVLNAPDGGFEVGKWYYMVALPTTLSSGYTMTFLDATGEVVAERVTDTPIAIKRAVWGKLTEADNVEEHISASKYLTFTSEGTTNLSLENTGGNAPVLYYSTDTKNWTLWDYSELTFSANAPLYICGDNPDGFNFFSSAGSSEGSKEIYSSFVAVGEAPFSISGDVMSLLDKNADVTSIPSEGCFVWLFNGCSNMVSGPDLPATSLTDNCYAFMFFGCSSLTSAPDLPATVLADFCYSGMFWGCSSLTTAPDLPATSLAIGCYSALFYDCTNLSVAPVLPATSVLNLAYNRMFHGCTSLTTAPELPATELEYSCYSWMFEECSNLTTAPEILPATTMYEECYRGMFFRCSSLTNTPKLPAMVMADSCYEGMFYECSSLVEAPELPATTLAEDCYRGMFWNSPNLAIASALPATSLVEDCYREMYSYCPSLTTAPILPATALADSCYYRMFDGCTSLDYIKCLATDISANGCTEYWLSGVAEIGTFVKASNAQWAKGSSGIPEGWTVENETQNPNSGENEGYEFENW